MKTLIFGFSADGMLSGYENSTILADRELYGGSIGRKNCGDPDAALRIEGLSELFSHPTAPLVHPPSQRKGFL